MKKTITHLIIGLGKGGAETMLYQVLKYRTDPALTHRVISFGASHYYEQPIRDLGIELIELPLKKNPVSALLRLPGLLKGSDTLCCWMYHANFLGYLAGRLAGVKKIVWCIHHSNLDRELNSATTLVLNRMCARLSKNVERIVYTGQRAKEIHEAVGYCAASGTIIKNGCACEEYIPDPDAAKILRQELKIPANKKIVLSVTKDLPIKDIPGFIEAFRILRKDQPDTVAVLCGMGVDQSNTTIAGLCDSAGLVIEEDIFLLGLRHDVPLLLAACDLYVLHSAGEAFPVTLIQAMSCGCLCVTTDVGDARPILAQDDCVVAPGKPDVLAEKMAELMCLPAEQASVLREQNRKRAMREYEIRNVISAYEEYLS